MPNLHQIAAGKCLLQIPAVSSGGFWAEDWRARINAKAFPKECLLKSVWVLELRCGWRWIRTTVGISQQIYSLPHLATLVSTRLRMQS